ncbi:alkylated DNA repair protein (DNA oxidative demethylase) [Arthrobacter pigmenti]|uniref:Alkylated DNA repair protein (DNA oxidative demethylase) n=1 Tax=Arthrobacter pigmenti TaxID=271432 RepID=A0A846RKE4_9MICC|nr:alpha-ketoglutarate-dependent dioxygenase AlkB [Arthrobacter pigmenti]NJC23798.1 alkylated DNA repair protein (DNA oxidative demethylase) [Arthrobacter pigmenti]
MAQLLPRERTEIAPGAFHVPDWLSPDQQRELIAACRDWATGPVPMRNTRMPNGSHMSVQTVCLGWHWMPYRYSKTADDVGGGTVAEFPSWLAGLGRDAVTAAYGERDDSYEPDAALINFYDSTAKMGMHQDREEKSLAPVVSLSIGDSCLFRFGNTETRNKPWTDVRLESGDLFVFGGASRLAYHGVMKTYPGTAEPSLELNGRLNITLRVTGL